MMKNKAMRCVWLVCGLLMLAVTSCKDDLLYTDGEPIPEGETTIIAQVDFRPLVEGLAGKSRTAGDAIKSIQDLCVLLYDTEGNFVEGHSLESISNANPTDGQFYVNEVTRKDGDAPDGGTIAETKTPQANLKLTIPYGRYYIYAVANMGEDFKKAVQAHGKENGAAEEVAKYKTAIATKEGLKSISLTWDVADVAKNSQMFGHFTIVGQENNSELITINKKGMKLHSWIRRAASKVTIAYDGSKLEEGVFIYLKSVTIKDIPQNCCLGQDNPAVPENYQPKDRDEGVKLDLIKNGETIK